MNKRNFLLVFVLLGTMGILRADSPVTSTDIASYYTEYEVVARNMGATELDQSTLRFLTNDQEPADVKAAVINAIGWQNKISKLAPVLQEELISKYGSDDLSVYSAADLMCLAYLMAMDDYFDVTDASRIMDMAAKKVPGSATIAMIRAVIKGQEAMDRNWCEVWELCRDALGVAQEPRDMKTAAIQNIVDYMILYKSYCY